VPPVDPFLQIYAFDTSAAQGSRGWKGVGTYKSAACRMFIDVMLRSQPTNDSVDPDQLFEPPGMNSTQVVYSRCADHNARDVVKKGCLGVKASAN
jgi:hypothetical protein